jgi:hypothetical protein
MTVAIELRIAETICGIKRPANHPARHSMALAKIDRSVSIDGGGRMERVQVAELLVVVENI